VTPTPVSQSRTASLGSGRIVFVSGQVAADGSVGIEGQLEQVYVKLAAAVGEAGGRMADVIRLATYLVHPADLDGYRTARAALNARFWGAGPFPTNTLVVVAGLARPEYRVEVEATAVVDT
jgi:enamine deaminase RidA (YjgF/YER057c/UK114 family)